MQIRTGASRADRRAARRIRRALRRRAPGLELDLEELVPRTGRQWRSWALVALLWGLAVLVASLR